MFSRGCSLILMLWLAGCALDPIYISASPDDDSFIWVAAGSVVDDYQPVPVGPTKAHEPAFVCRAKIRSQGFHGFHPGELRDGRCQVPESGSVWTFSTPHYEQLLSKAGTAYRWAPVAEFPTGPLMLGPLYTNNRVHTAPIFTETEAAQTIWYPCTAFYNGQWQGGKIDIGPPQQRCYIAADLGSAIALYDGVLVLYAPADSQ